MHTYLVICYKATALSFFTQADDFYKIKIKTKEELPAVIARLSKFGLELIPNKKWIMPGAILSVEKL